MPQTALDLPFRFRYVNSHNQTVGWRSAPGLLSEHKIQLKGHELDYSTVLNSTCRDRRLALIVNPMAVRSEAISQHLVGGHTLILEISGTRSLEVVQRINRVSSRHFAENHRRSLEREGKKHAFRCIPCPHCESTIDLSQLNKTPYVYCRYCETIFQERSDLKTIGNTYRLCDECGWFDRVQGYSEFYFYILLIVYCFSYKRRHLCDTCVNRTVRKMFFINFIFILGIIPTLWMKIKSLMGRDTALKELAKANAIAKKGNYAEADIIYSRLYERYPEHPGLLLSQSMGHLQGQDMPGAWQRLERSLKSCSNYSPTFKMMNRIQSSATKN